jgi:exodeoxyribonuclease V
VNLTANQQLAIDSVHELQRNYPDGGKVGVISGYAGTGKSTLIGVLVDEFDDATLVCAPTGKATVRVREIASIPHGCTKTIHSWLYEVKEDPVTGVLEWGLKRATDMIRPECGFLVVDEASMVTAGMFKDMYRRCKELNINLILVGDSFQLPPVEMKPELADFSVFHPKLPAAFRVNLTEIHRQALDSPIIRASMGVRTGQLPGEALADLPLVLPDNLANEATEVFKTEGVAVCHRNLTRHLLNSGVRTRLGHPSDQLVQGEPLLVIQNNYPLEIFNGETAEILSRPAPINDGPVAVRDAQTNNSIYVNYLGVEVDTPLKGRQSACVADREVFGRLEGVGPYCVKREAKRLLGATFGFTPDGACLGPSYLQANLGYVLTAHKAQGSEWTHGIVVMEPSIKLGTTEGRRWTYTALTRFKKQVRICWKRS